MFNRALKKIREPLHKLQMITGDQEDMSEKLCQWTSSDGTNFYPAAKTYLELPPAAYEIKTEHVRGLFFEKVPLKTEGLIRFPDSNSDTVIKEIEVFWEKEGLYKIYDIAHKRGILLYGPPGSGKSSTIQIIVADVIHKRGGCVLKFDDPDLFIDGMRKFREIQPNAPIVVLMEDLDSIIEMWDESEVLNVLDGVDDIKKVVFLATSNYPERLEDRFSNRPSRFDRRFHMPHPNEESRRIYFKHLIEGREAVLEDYEIDIDLDLWVKDTADMSIAHLKELFVSVAILGNSYKEKIASLQMFNEEKPSSKEDKTGKFGFGTN